MAGTILITGCSSGFGRETAVHFARKGWRVFASMRRPDTDAGESLGRQAVTEGWSLTTPRLDVTDDASVAQAVAEVLRETAGRLDVLVNNAGYYCFGPLEEITPAELSAQLETNVVGAHRVTRAVLPAMRRQRAGAVAFLGSISGRVAIPVVGPYHASKYALEGMVESLRYELIPFGVRVVLIEPGPFQTALHAKEVRAAQAGQPESPYAALAARYQEQSSALRRSPRVDLVVRTIERAVLSQRPRLRWPVGPTSFLATRVRPFVPDRLYEWVMRRAFRLRRPG